MTPEHEKVFQGLLTETLIADAHDIGSLLGSVSPLCLAAVAMFGSEAQERIAIEEMAELTVAVLHHRRGRADQSVVSEEIADVFIVAMQLALVYGPREVAEAIAAKSERLRERMREERRLA